MPYLSASAVVIHYEVALYQVYVPLPLLRFSVFSRECRQYVETAVVYQKRQKLSNACK